MDTNKLVLLPFFCVFVSAKTGGLHFDADLTMISKELVSVHGKSKSSESQLNFVNLLKILPKFTRNRAQCQLVWI